MMRSFNKEMDFSLFYFLQIEKIEWRAHDNIKEERSNNDDLFERLCQLRVKFSLMLLLLDIEYIIGFN